MAERPIGVTDSPSGAGIAQIRTRERTVAAESVVEQYLIPTPDRVVRGTCMASTWRTLGIATADTHLAFLFNRVGSGVLVAPRRITVQIDTAGASGTVRSTEVSRISAYPAGGTLLTPVLFDTAGVHAALVECTGATASDGGAATAITATAGSSAWLQMAQHAVSVIGQIRMPDEPLTPLESGADPPYLREGEGLLVTNVEAASSSAHYVVNFAWDEFTL